MLQYVPIIITALLGLLGLISKTKKDDKPGYFNKLTPFGVVVCLLLLSSFITAIWLQNNKDRENEVQKKEAKNRALIESIKQKHQFELDSVGREATITGLEKQKSLIEQQKLDDSIRFNVNLSNFGAQLIRQNQTLINIQKIIHSFKNVSFEYTIEISEGKSISLKKYIERVQSGIDSLIPTLKSSYTPIRYLTNDGVSIVGFNNNDMPVRFSIKRNSSLYPKSSGDEKEIYFLFNVKPTLYFYKKPIDIKQTQFYFQNFNSSEEMNIAQANGQLENLQYPDIEKTYNNPDEKDYELVYYKSKNTITISTGSSALSDGVEPTGAIKSIPDLAKARFFIQFSDIDSLVKISPQGFELHFDDLPLALSSVDAKMYKRSNNIYFEYNLENKIKEVLLRWQEK